MTAGFDWGKDPTVTITHPECNDLTISLTFRGFPSSRFMNRFADALTKDGFVVCIDREVEIVRKVDQWTLPQPTPAETNEGDSNG